MGAEGCAHDDGQVIIQIDRDVLNPTATQNEAQRQDDAESVAVAIAKCQGKLDARSKYLTGEELLNDKNNRRGEDFDQLVESRGVYK